MAGLKPNMQHGTWKDICIPYTLRAGEAARRVFDGTARRLEFQPLNDLFEFARLYEFQELAT